MGKADNEIQSILSHLTVIYWRNTNTSTGFTHKPQGADWVQLDRLVHRLLVLRGTIKMDEKVPEDPWELYLSEYAPVGTRRPAMEKPPASQSYPNSILMRSSSSSSSSSSVPVGDRGQQQQQQQQPPQIVQTGSQDNAQQQNQQHQQGDDESERHIRFELNLPGRGRGRRFPVSPAPISRT